MKPTSLLPVLISAVITGLSGLPTQAALMVDYQSVEVNSTTQEALFTIGFNEVPDFLSVDEFGAQADSFQYFIDADGEFPVPGVSEELEAIIRGEEIYIAGDVRVREISGNGGLNSGGWGPIRGSVPFSLNGSVLTFSTPWQFIDDSNGQFSYALEWYEFGSFRGRLESGVPVPEPSSALGVFTFGVLGASLFLKRKLKKQSS